MDERRPSPRRRTIAAGPLVGVGLAALGIVTLSTVGWAATATRDDPLATVTASRLIPELVVAAVVATVLVGLTLWLVLPSAPAPRTTRSPSAGALWPRALGMLGWFALVALLLVLAQRMTAGTETPEEVPVDTSTAQTSESELPRARPESGLIKGAITIGGVVVVLVLATGAALTLARWRDRPSGPDSQPDPAPPREPTADGATLPAVRAALARAHDGLTADHDPRLAVIEAYWHMEQAMASAGVPPLPAETSSEFLDRALGSVGRGAEGAVRLTQLFEWAMFSHHPIDDSMRDDARDALREVASGLVGRERARAAGTP